jgi:hypothetical protein
MDFYLVKNKHILKFCKYVLINELHKNKSFSGKKLLGINALLLPNYKKHFGAQKKYKGNGLKFVNSYHFLVHPTMHLPSNH